MPVAAVALAATSFAAGATAFAAATTLAGSIAAGAMMVGSALSIVGTITGNAKLAKIGGVMALAGGLGTLAVNAAAEVGKQAAADSLASTGGQMADAGASAMAEGVADTAANAATSGVEVGSVNLGGTEQYALPDAAGAGLQEAGQVGGMLSQTQAAAAPAVNPAAAAPAQAPADITSASAMDASNTVTGQVAEQTGAETANAANKINAFSDARYDAQNAITPEWTGTGSAADPGMMAKFEAWTKANPATAKLLMEGGKGMLGALVTSPKDQAMIDYYKANAEQINRRKLWGSGRTA